MRLSHTSQSGKTERATDLLPTPLTLTFPFSNQTRRKQKSINMVDAV